MVLVLERRYPTGHYVVTQLEVSEASDFHSPQADTDGDGLVEPKEKAALWIDKKSLDVSDFRSLIMSTPLLVHELNHDFGRQLAFDKDPLTYAYAVTCEQIHALDTRACSQSPSCEPQTFAVSDVVSYLAGSLGQGDGEIEENDYLYYLENNKGTQGLDFLLDEYNAYIHQVITAYNVNDYWPPGIKSNVRDSVISFSGFLLYYLRHARLEQTEVYDAIAADQKLSDVIRTLWLRAQLALEVTEEMLHLQSKKAPGRHTLVYDSDPTLVQEIEPFL